MPILGICNGFQVLTEAHLLPGALLRNTSLRFHCFWQHIRIEQSDTAWTNALGNGDVLRLPIAHGEGAYYVDQQQLAELDANGQVVARYCTADGDVSDEANQNGSIANIAAVCNEKRNVVGLMPHPERATNALIGGEDGLKLLRSVLSGSGVA
jgi:phosphoribosylformylglycinamidine synthase